jgi:undecaprenyl-diphosphatase
MIGLVITLADQISSGICKPFFARFRPTQDPDLMYMIDIVNGYRGGRFGFTSSHAANTFAVAVFVSLLMRSWSLSITMILWAALNAYSRIYLGVHYPGDILFGTLTGIGVGVLVYILYHLLKNKFLQRPQYISNQYTSSGYLTTDISLLLTVMTVTVLVIVIYGMILGNLLNF